MKPTNKRNVLDLLYERRAKYSEKYTQYDNEIGGKDEKSDDVSRALRDAYLYCLVDINRIIDTVIE